MAIEARVIGNLLTNPEQRFVPVKGEQKKITELRIMSDVYKRDADENLVQDEEKSEPVNITIWNEKLGDEVAKLFKKGCRVIAIGDQTVQTWQDRQEDKDRYQVHVTAEIVALIPYRVDSITFRQKQQRTPAAETA